MNKKQLILGSLRTMGRYRLRTFFMSVGVVLGVGALVIMRSYGQGAEQEIMEKVNRMFAPNNIFITPGKGPMAEDPGGPVTTLVLEDLHAVADQVSEVVAWDAMVMMYGEDVAYKDITLQLTIKGHTERAPDVWNRGVIRGEPITAEENGSASRVALLGTKVADQLFGDEDPVGRSIQINNSPFRVKGVLEPQGIDPHGMDRDEEIHVPLNTMMRRMKNIDYVQAAKLLVQHEDQTEAASENVARILRERHAIAPGEDDDFTVITPKLVRAMVGEVNKVFMVFLPAAAGLALLIAAFVIANIMLMSVKERVGEIGLRKAVGATDRQIAGQFLLEATSLTFISGLLGLILGLGLVRLMTRMADITMIVAPDALVLGLAAAVLTGILAGWLPAHRAAAMEPVEALQ